MWRGESHRDAYKFNLGICPKKCLHAPQAFGKKRRVFRGAFFL
jgi:hypothetical protein